MSQAATRLSVRAGCTGACLLGQWGLTAPGIEPTFRKGLRDRNSPTCTLSQNGYGDFQCKGPGSWAYVLLRAAASSALHNVGSNPGPFMRTHAAGPHRPAGEPRPGSWAYLLLRDAASSALHKVGSNPGPSTRTHSAGPACQQAERYTRWVRTPVPLFGPTRRDRTGGTGLPAGRGPGRPPPPPQRPDLRCFFGVGVGGRLRLRLLTRWGLAARVQFPAGAACLGEVRVGELHSDQWSHAGLNRGPYGY